MLCKRTPIEDTCDAMRRHCGRSTTVELHQLCSLLLDRIVETNEVIRWGRRLPWETKAERDLRELVALRWVVVWEIFDRSAATSGMSTS